MKLRIKDNSLRLRLTQSEVIQFGREGEIMSSMHLPDGTRFTYVLQSSIEKEIDVFLDKFTLKVLIPEKEVHDWVETENVGIEKSIPIGNGDLLRIWVEKDFKCLTVRPHEDETDHFENPRKSH